MITAANSLKKSSSRVQKRTTETAQRKQNNCCSLKMTHYQSVNCKAAKLVELTLNDPGAFTVQGEYVIRQLREEMKRC